MLNRTDYGSRLRVEATQSGHGDNTFDKVKTSLRLSSWLGSWCEEAEEGSLLTF